METKTIGQVALGIASVAVLIDLIFHKFYFEPNMQDLIRSGYFRVEGLFYYGTKFLVILVTSAVFWHFYSGKPVFPVLNAFAAASLFSLFYYLVRPTGPFTEAYLGFLAAMYLTHFAAILAPSLVVWRIAEEW